MFVIDIFSCLLSKHFRASPEGARKSAKTVCIDFYMPYMALIKIIFPNAKIIVDHFHIVSLLAHVMPETCIQVMKYFNTKPTECKRLKKYRELRKKKQTWLNGIEFKKFSHFKSLV